LLASQRNLAEDIEKFCRSKRLKKNIMKMDLLHASNNNSRIPLDSALFTAASSDPINNYRQSIDPVIALQFKRKNSMLYQELQAFEADRILFLQGVDPQYVHENDYTLTEKLQDYDDLHATRRTSASSSFTSARKEKVNATRSYAEKKEAEKAKAELSQQERLAILQQL